jgi:Tfp pilus assembly protein PilZ
MRDSRSFPRKKIDGEVEIFINGGIFLGGLKDISEGGLSVTTSTPYEVGYEMFLSVKLAEPLERVNALAEVVWVHPTEATLHPTGMGLKFLALTEEDFYKLEKILEMA